jgi:hypothetical protein
MLTKSRDPWMQTIGLLSFMSFDTPARVAAKPSHEWRLSAPCKREAAATGSVKVVDRPSATTATIAWSDPTSCCYGDQIWRSSVARREGVCAVSGRQIHPGDAVYKPRTCIPAPANAHAMILSAVVHDAVR